MYYILVESSFLLVTSYLHPYYRLRNLFLPAIIYWLNPKSRFFFGADGLKDGFPWIPADFPSEVFGQQAGSPCDGGALGLRLHAGGLRRSVFEQRPGGSHPMRPDGGERQVPQRRAQAGVKGRSDSHNVKIKWGANGINHGFKNGI